MKSQTKRGFGFGITSGIITTLGMIVGLHSSTHLKSVVLGGIIIIAIADSLSDAFSIHVSEEFENKSTHKESWQTAKSTFLSKLIFALSFIIPILLFPLKTAIIISIIWGLLLITLFNIYMAKKNNTSPKRLILEHLSITILVIIVTHLAGDWINSIF